MRGGGGCLWYCLEKCVVMLFALGRRAQAPAAPHGDGTRLLRSCGDVEPRNIRRTTVIVRHIDSVWCNGGSTEPLDPLEVAHGTWSTEE